MTACSYQNQEPDPGPEPEPDPELEFELSQVTDCQGNTYDVVKIGEQYWMKENLRSTKYDTQSEKAGQTLLTFGDYTYAPYYTDGRNDAGNYSSHLTDVQRDKLGMLYNWAAAAGLTEAEAIEQSTDFSSKRQGICPNGYHLPTYAEWKTLTGFVGANAGNKLKANFAWYKSNAYITDADNYGFSALPAGYAGGYDTYIVGIVTYFWSATSDNDVGAYSIDIGCSGEEVYCTGSYKNFGLSVRCVRD